jgi:cysteinylglycine-S-conjugate dipeptidase
VIAGSAGSLPMAAEISRASPQAELLLAGVADPESRTHSENESVHLGELLNCCVSEAILLDRLSVG